MQRWVLGIASVGALCGLGILWFASTRPEPHGAQSNVLVVVWDTVRADRMSLYGHGVSTTPLLDRRVTDGVVFESAYSSSFWTLPAHASLFTGLPTNTHRAHGASRWLSDSHPTLAERLSELGYDTYGFTQNPNIQPTTNLHRGFDRLETARTPEWTEKILAYNRRKIPADDASTAASPAFDGERKEIFAKDGGPWAQRAAEAWLDGREDPSRPWFIFLNYMEAHAPRVPGEEARSAVMDAEMNARAKRTPVNLARMAQANRREIRFEPSEVAGIRAVYDASIWELDRSFDALLQALDARGELEHTWVILLSDHGELLGENGLFGHSKSLAEPLVRIPLVVWAPRSASDRPVGRRAEPVSLNDVHGLVLQAAGLPSQPTIFDPGRPVVSEYLFPAHSKRRPAMRRSWVEGDRRLIASSNGNRMLLDRAGDPAKRVDLRELEPDRFKGMLRDLERWIRRTERPDSDERPPDLNADQREELEVLGYAQ